MSTEISGERKAFINLTVYDPKKETSNKQTGSRAFDPE
jgi:hypothetical protein